MYIIIIIQIDILFNIYDESSYVLTPDGLFVICDSRLPRCSPTSIDNAPAPGNGKIFVLSKFTAITLFAPQCIIMGIHVGRIQTFTA
ncbi:hypothetical protein DERF_013809 [Dermatophagoides farinae]|uniref:Uncharacterized protein n=1 Tax=Dermatophagoides farinae TaxID=6954 RepID=A0A922HRX6_DERFA|nr:hypothetical protein DERF_013809 [Dermatophagoides farinae]